MKGYATPKKNLSVLLLADINSEHTIKWANSLASQGIQVALMTLTCPASWARKNLSKKIVTLSPKYRFSSLPVLKYLSGYFRTQRFIKKYRPDIVHAHYISSYGLVGSLSQSTNLILSVWGSDIMSFPRKNFLARKIIEFNLAHAKLITSTSYFMVPEIKKYTDKTPYVIPFGIDINKFIPTLTMPLSHQTISIGSIKTLSPVYGTDILIKAFALVKQQYTSAPIKLILAGAGDKKPYLELAKKLGIDSDVDFQGRLSSEFVPQSHQLLDIFVSLSRQESFGVSPLEAMATERPVVATAVGGHLETIIDKKNGLLCPKDDPEAAAKAILSLLNDPDFARHLGKEGRIHVENNFDWKKNIQQMLQLYSDLSNNHDE